MAHGISLDPLRHRAAAGVGFRVYWTGLLLRNLN